MGENEEYHQNPDNYPLQVSGYKLQGRPNPWNLKPATCNLEIPTFAPQSAVGGSFSTRRTDYSHIAFTNLSVR